MLMLRPPRPPAVISDVCLGGGTGGDEDGDEEGNEGDRGGPCLRCFFFFFSTFLLAVGLGGVVPPLP